MKHVADQIVRTVQEAERAAKQTDVDADQRRRLAEQQRRERAAWGDWLRFAFGGVLFVLGILAFFAFLTHGVDFCAQRADNARRDCMDDADDDIEVIDACTRQYEAMMVHCSKDDDR
jgi:hypothetical protein